MLIAILVLFVGVIVAGTISSAFYFRYKYEDISERMHRGCKLVRDGKSREEILEVLTKH